MLTNACNFRSLKGLPAFEGRRIAGHTIVRSDQLCRLDEADWQRLQAIGLKTVCDLRSDGERERFPNRLPTPGPQEVSMPLISDVRGDVGYRSMLAEQPDGRGAKVMMMAVYRNMPGALAPHLRRLFALFEQEEVPVLIHCAAGKDRTGFAVAVLLHALGASRETILEDYLLSASSGVATDPEKREQIHEMMFELTGRRSAESMIDGILGVDEAYLQAAFDVVQSEYGGMDRYLAEVAGLDTAGIAQLRARWLS